MNRIMFFFFCESVGRGLVHSLPSWGTTIIAKFKFGAPVINKNRVGQSFLCDFTLSKLLLTKSVAGCTS